MGSGRRTLEDSVGFALVVIGDVESPIFVCLVYIGSKNPSLSSSLLNLLSLSCGSACASSLSFSCDMEVRGLGLSESDEVILKDFLKRLLSSLRKLLEDENLELRRDGEDGPCESCGFSEAPSEGT